MLRHTHLSTRAMVAAVFATLLSTSASADTVTFWKTIQCPEFNGKFALARQAGTMEAPVVLDPLVVAPTPISTGGPYCNLDEVGDTTSPPAKFIRITNASVGPRIQTPAGDAWDCVICQYPNKVIFIGAGMPAVSLTALAFLGGGLATFGLIRLRRRHQTGDTRMS